MFGTGYTGTVQSGTGNTYQVLLNTGAVVSVTILQIASTETIPAGTQLIVVQFVNAYYSQVPVWIA
jgi:hypothetical protein